MSVLNEKIFSNLYEDKRVLVTGHTGFKGSWLTLWLLQLGAKVGGFSKYLPSEPCLFNYLNIRDKVENFEGNICDLNDVRNAFEKFKPEIVFHLAAQPIVRKSYDDPKETFDINIGGTVVVLDCIRTVKGVEAGVIITSDKCYENFGLERGYIESDPLGGSDPYSASKGCAEIVTRSYFRSFFNKKGMPRIASARAGNVIGGGDWAQDRIIPDCVKAWQKGEDVIVRKPEATRPWQHVLESLSGYLWLGASILLDEGINGESFNFGPKDEGVGSVGALTDMFLKYLGSGKWKHAPLEKNKKEADLLTLNCDKALDKLKWQPVLDFKQTVEMTALWYKKYYEDSEAIESFSISQINSYVDKAKERSIKWAS